MNFKYELYRPSEDIVNDGMKTIDDYRFQEEPYKKSFTSNNKVYNKFINIMKDLNKNEIKTTFFVGGSWAKDNILLLQKM